MKNGVIIVFLILFSSFVYADVYINEIMFDPAGSDNNKEFIEIKGTNNLSDYIFGDLASNDTLEQVQYNNNSNFSLIVEEGFNYSYIDSSIYNVGATIGNSLNNDGDTIYLYFNDDVIDFISYGGSLASNNGYSLELVNGSFIESLEINGTPGRENTGVPKQINETIDDGKLTIKIEISNNTFNLSDVLEVNGNITTTFLSVVQANLTVKIARKISSWKYKWLVIENYPMNISNTTIINYNWSLPDDLIIGEYKVLATVKYGNTRTSQGKEFYVNGLEDLGEHNLTIIKSPSSMRFGDIKTVFLKFDSNNYNFETLSFVAYLYSPRWASIDLDDKTLRTRPYETNVAVHFNNMSRGQTIYLSIPLLSKRNCDDDFNNGNYKGKVRIYENTDEKIIEEEFNMLLSGVNDAMCPKTIVRSSGSKTSTPPIIVSSKEKNVFTHDQVRFIIDMPKNITREFDVNISLENPTISNKEFDLWSYAYSGSLSLMERKLNKEKISLKANETQKIVLKNVVTKKDIPIKEYKVMVKIKSPNMKSEKTYSIPIDIIIEQEEIKKNKIKSFYTRAKKHSEKINLFASCENEAKLILESKKGVQIKNCTGITRFEVEIDKGTNLFYLSIEKDDELEDMKKMLVFSNGETLTYHKETTKIYELMNNYKEEADKGLGLVTGNIVSEKSVIYESSNTKLKKLIKYLIPTIFILLIGMFLVRRNGDKKGRKTND